MGFGKAIPFLDKISFVNFLLIAMLDAITPECVYGIFKQFNKPGIEPFSPKEPCNALKHLLTLLSIIFEIN